MSTRRLRNRSDTTTTRRNDNILKQLKDYSNTNNALKKHQDLIGKSLIVFFEVNEIQDSNEKNKQMEKVVNKLVKSPTEKRNVERLVKSYTTNKNVLNTAINVANAVSQNPNALKPKLLNATTKNIGIDQIINLFSTGSRKKNYEFYGFYKHNKNTIIDEDILVKKNASEKKKALDMIFNNGILNVDELNPDLLHVDGDKYVVNNVLDNLNANNKVIELRPELIGAVNVYERELNKITNMSDLPIYIIIKIGKGIHVIILMLYQSKVYTIGYGYSGRLKVNNNNLHYGDGALYSPDYLFSPNEDRFKNTIIDIGIMSSSNLNHIEKFINKVHNIISMLEKVDDTGMVKTYSNILSGDLGKYSTYSNRNIPVMNCTSFITRIFNHLDCSNYGLDDPSKCKTVPPLTDEKVQKFVELYKGRDTSDKIIEMIQLLHRNPVRKQAWLGGKKSRKNK